VAALVGLVALLAPWPVTGAGRAGAATAVWLAGDYVDYAPTGLPDFSQCRPEWSQPGSPGQWTYAGPTALADVLWWLDSAAEPAPRPPSEPHDGFGLVTAYPIFGPAFDDHDQVNLFPLIEDLAGRAGTDGRGGQTVTRGTRWEDLTAAVSQYLHVRRQASRYQVVQRAAPDTAWLTDQLTARGGVVLQLGVWERQAEGWRRVGGHYAALAGVDDLGRVALSDPLADGAALGAPGRAVPPGAAGHSCREAPRAHDDAAVVSHDAYALAEAPDLPDGRRLLEGYFQPANWHEAAAFAGQNPSTALQDRAGTWQRGEVVMALDGAIAIRPGAGVAPTASPTRGGASPTRPASSATPSAPGPTASRSPEASPTATATSTEPIATWTPSPTVRPLTPGAVRSRTPTPRPTRAAPVDWLWLPVVVSDRKRPGPG
jgi:hypothetical protein